MKLKAHAVDKVGQWTPKDGLNVTDKYAFQHGKEINSPNHHHISKIPTPLTLRLFLRFY